MRFHVLTCPHTLATDAYSACAYTQKARKFARMMMARGHTVYFYGHEHSDVEGELVPVVSATTYESVYGAHDYHSKFFRYDLSDAVYREYHDRAVAGIRARIQPGDFILPFWGAGNRSVCDAVPEGITVEPGIGYASGHWARFKIFESYAIYHAWCGLDSVGTCRQDWYAAVIPNYFDPDEFEFSAQKQDYWLALGRVYSGKGIDIAVQATERTGQRLIIAGQGTLREMGYSRTPDHVTEVGYADIARRRKLMRDARGAIIASQYLEPFGGVQVENLFSGTPTVTTDRGAFTENNPHGITVYRCRDMSQFEWAIRNIDQIQPAVCREFAERNFSMAAVAPRYEEYFDQVLAVYQGQGWYQAHEHQGPQVVHRHYPGHA